MKKLYKGFFFILMALFPIFCHTENSLRVDYEIKEENTEVLSKGITDFNTPYFGNQKEVSFAIYLLDKNEKIIGGILAWMRPGLQLLFIDTLWIDEAFRHQGYGTQLILAAEKEGKKHGCTHSQLETLPFQAENFYSSLGYSRIGVVEKLYGEHDAIYMRKQLRG